MKFQVRIFFLSFFDIKYLTVTDFFLFFLFFFSVDKYVSEAERKKMAEEEEERLKAASMNQGDNAPERALMEMMGGTLEQEQGLNALEQELVREEWMVRFKDVSILIMLF